MKFKKIYVEITNVCNLRCDFCPDTKRKKEFIELEDFEKIIKQVSRYTNLVYLHVKGEPLLHPKFKEILKILEKYNLKCNITTNGTLLKENLEIIKNSNVIRQINLSIHSITQNKKFNNTYLNDIFRCADELDNIIISYRLWNLKSISENTINDNLIKEIEKYYSIIGLKDYLKAKSFFKLKDNVFINQDTEFFWPGINKKTIIEKGRCLALKDQIAILVDGTVVPCCLDNDGDIPLGNILFEDMEDILNKSLSLSIKENFEKGIITCNLCKTCGFLKRLESKRGKNI